MPRWVWVLTVPTEQPSRSATCASGRSSKKRSTSAARWRAGSAPSACRTASATACRSWPSASPARSGTLATGASRRHPTRHHERRVLISMRRR